MKNPILSAAFALISFASSAQIANADFENWYSDTSGNTLLSGWEHLNKNGGQASGHLWGTRKDNNSQHGAYALMLSRWYSYAWDNIRQQAPVSFKPLTLSGYYKYTKTALAGAKMDDTAEVDAYLTVWNTPLNKRDTLGTGKQKLSAQNNYTLFNCTINYGSPLMPDSILIHIEPSIFKGIGADCADSNYCSFLSIDNLSLSENTGIEAPYVQDEIRIYPNPASTSLNIKAKNEIKNVVITNMTGEIMLNRSFNNTRKLELDITGLPKGLYFIRLNAAIIQKFIKQ